MSAQPNPAPQRQRKASRNHGGVPRMFVAEAYHQAIPTGHMALLGFFSRLLSYSRTGHASDGREIVSLDVPRSVLAEDCGVALKTVRRWEGLLIEAHILRPLKGSANARVLEILPPPSSPMRALGGDSAPDEKPVEVVTHDHLGDCGQTVDNLLAKETGRWSPATTSGGHPRPPHRFLTPLRNESKKVSASAVADRTEPSSEEGGEAHRVAIELTGFAAKAIEKLRADGRDTSPLGRRRRIEIRKGLAKRWESYGSPGTATENLTRDFHRLLAYALRPATGTPAGYLAGVVAAGDWKSIPDPKSQSAAITKAGPKAERPVEDLNRRSGGGLLDVSQDRLAKAMEAICAHPKAPEKLIDGVRSLKPSTPAEALRLAISLEQAVVALGESH